MTALNILVTAYSGMFGRWLGYWIGHAAGWSRNAEWPGTIGGGTGATLLSVCVGVSFGVLAAAVLLYLPDRRVRRAIGSELRVPATVIGVAEAGGAPWTRVGRRRLVDCHLEVRPTDAAPYRVRVVQFVDDATRAFLGPGARVAVHVEPGAPGHVAIDEPLSRAAR